ncbi:TPA: SDR family oxidoreductase [Legionella pneumophila]|uniref:3-oxoacyl-ACP reductase n=1 Tax=Legionella pneumophila subsp. pascullei TaxID=91890 RepID=A0AAX2IUY2_LEGPN|nr:SDR family oxidoreductase [Legionella pneumophila]HAT9118092.1 SDR family oxidoreductase [Legionella pneumophila subsp. pneumophila]AMP91814.1 short-chain dehydrogenase [Legionella pneumophila subsp. pascullei]APF05626.1 short-chain dehydrogenase [Legionella pneumophila subsp. fraseri]SQG89632.1 3-oxoacyl-ACP reductase [Legionella pneumophila subsp. pascullei]VEH05096.1 3-oxoacyl-ACP reductase [Legionella pneumophila subsp. pascullei]
MSYSKPETAPRLSDLFSLRGKTALVIGGAGLLGSEITHAFAEQGANVIIASRSLEKCQNYTNYLAENFKHSIFTSLSVDISNPESIDQFMHTVNELFPDGLDILVNCGWSGRKNTFESISDEDWNLDIEICLNGVFRTIKRAYPLLKKKKGNILNIASMYGHVAPDYRLYDSERFANPPSYGAAKAGLIQLTKYLASFLSPHQIRVNAISPGPFPFESTQKENPDFIQRLNSKNPLNRIGKPHELKGAAILLCSEAGSYITGQNICVDGGWGVW